MTSDAPFETMVVPDEAALVTTVAQRLLERLATVQAEDRVPHIALTGGTIAEVLHRRIAELSPGSGIDWSRVVVWWGDERFVASDSPDRNARLARREFLDVVGADPANIHEMASTADVADLAAGAAAYDTEVREHGSGELDVLMLGLGPDGHVASLFPGHRALDVDDRAATWVDDSPKPPPARITLTLGALNRSRSVWFLVSGEGKADAVAAARAEAGSVLATPARGVTGREETVWFLDEAAAVHL